MTNNTIPASALALAPSSALSDAIKIVAIGKRGSKDLTTSNSEAVVQEIKTTDYDPVQLTALFTAIKIKSIAESEQALLQWFGEENFTDDRKFLVKLLGSTYTDSQYKIFLKLLNNKTLTADENKIMADVMFANKYSDTIRSFLVTSLRMNYATIEQYTFLYRALEKKFKPSFRHLWSEQKTHQRTILQFAEPFDGLTHSYLLTPLLMHHFQKKGFRCFALMGTSAGPKFGNNLLQIYQQLQNIDKHLVHQVKSSKELLTDNPLGNYIDLEDISPEFSLWIDLRKRLLKRPFMATLEKYANSYQSDVLIASAFHGNFSEIMISLAERLNFKAAIIVRKGREGSLGFSLSKPVEIYCTALANKGYIRQNFIFSLQDLGKDFRPDGRDNITAKENADLLYQYLQKPKDIHPQIKQRVELTIAGLEKAMNWVEDSSPRL